MKTFVKNEIIKIEMNEIGEERQYIKIYYEDGIVEEYNPIVICSELGILPYFRKISNELSKLDELPVGS